MRGPLTLLALLSTLPFAALAACSGDDDVTPAPIGDAGPDAPALDASHASDASPDANPLSTPDAGPDAADASPDAPSTNDGDTDADAGPTQSGTLIATGDVTLNGFTSDGYVVYTLNGSVYAKSVAGGAAQLIVNSAYELSFRRGSSAVIVFNPSAAIAQIGSLAVWTAAHGYQPVAPHAMSVGRSLDVSLDGNSIAYVAVAPSTSSVQPTGILVSTTDGSAAQILLEMTDPGGDLPSTWFGSNGTLFTQYSKSLADAGPNAKVDYTDAYDGATFAHTLSVTGDAVSSPTGTSVWVLDASSGTEKLYDTKTGASLFSQANTGSGGLFDPTGSHTFFCTPAGALVTLAIASPSTQTTLLASGCDAVGAVSPNGGGLLMQTIGDGGAPMVNGLSTAAAFPPWPIWNGYLQDLKFTRDSRYVLAHGANGVSVIPSAGGVPTQLPPSVGYPQPAIGSKFILLTNEVLGVYDASGASAPATLATGVSSAVLADTFSMVGYVTGSGASASLYLAPIL